MGSLLAYAGDWERGMSSGPAAPSISTPQHLRRSTTSCLIDHYRRGEYEDALTSGEAIEPSELRRNADSERRRGRSAGARHRGEAAFDGLRRHHPAYVDPDKVRSFLGGLDLGGRDCRPAGRRIPESEGARRCSDTVARHRGARTPVPAIPAIGAVARANPIPRADQRLDRRACRSPT